ncbi:ABC transporter ATP-binding protein [Paenibacillus wynnii]|uniref:ABC transporter ATP-binding protein n=1 Tax=Paenibacillus wynnii TaxID=268407 RepID=UPI00069008FA|nr:ABC transporter ATP-binding protein [Paenibacillus wynnii]
MKLNSENIQSPLIELEQVGKIYNGVTVLDEVSMKIESGSATAIIGRNGSGKSTLLSILAGLIQISNGRLLHKDKRMKIGYAPEFFPPLKFTPEEFLRSVGRFQGLAPKEIDHRITELLVCFRLESYRTRSMESFSKGMLQKVNLMQSMLNRPPLLLLDEPMSGLDAHAQDSLLEFVHEMKRQGTALVFSAHESQWIEALADEVHVLHAGRTIRTVNRTELHSSIYYKIVFKGVSQPLDTPLEQMPGFLSMALSKEQQDADCPVISVQAIECDTFLRTILGAGGSILSVERKGGLSGLELWMNPQEASKRGAAS